MRQSKQPEPVLTAGLAEAGKCCLDTTTHGLDYCGGAPAEGDAGELGAGRAPQQVEDKIAQRAFADCADAEPPRLRPCGGKKVSEIDIRPGRGNRQRERQLPE